MIYNHPSIESWTKCFSLLRTPMVLEILFASLSIWPFQFKCSFIVKPRKLKSLTLSMDAFSMLSCSRSTFFCGVWKIIYLLLVIFRDSLLHFSQSFIYVKSKLILDSTSVLFILLRMISIVVERVVSSAYIMNLNKLLEFAIL